jgi:hypothetical protein
VNDIMRAVRPYQVVVLLALLLAAMPLGCSPKLTTGKVKGKVTYKGKPVKEGSVTFLNLTEGGTAGADLQSDGSFDAGEVVAGEYVVVINPPMEMKDTDPGKSPPAPVEKNMPDIPQRYRQQGSTTLKAKVQPGENDPFVFDMK